MLQCSNCGGSIVYNIESKRFKCLSCDTVYPINQITDAEEVESEQISINQFTCPSCGGEIYTRDNTASSFCSFCGSSNSLTAKMVSWKKPNKIVPFEITKEQAREKLKAKMKNWFTPKEFSILDNLDNYRGIYIPYWCYTVEVTSNAQNVDVTYSRSSGNTTYYQDYKLCTELVGRFEGLTYDASKSFPDDISEGLNDFDFGNKLVPFNSAYFSGFYADLADVKPDTYQSVLLKDCKDISQDLLKDKLNHINSSEGSPSIKGVIPYDGKVVACELVMCPVWFLSFRENNRVIYGVVNGVTGDTVSDIPISKPKVLGTILGISIPLFALFYFIFNLTIPVLIIANIAFIIFSLGSAKIADLHIKVKKTGKVEKKMHSIAGFAMIVLFLTVWVSIAIGSHIHIVNDMFAYVLAFISGVIGIGSLIRTISKFNELATRELPHFKYEGGNTRNV